MKHEVCETQAVEKMISTLSVAGTVGDDTLIVRCHHHGSYSDQIDLSLKTPVEGLKRSN